jgi:hypothetical protein
MSFSMKQTGTSTDDIPLSYAKTGRNQKLFYGIPNSFLQIFLVETLVKTLPVEVPFHQA